MEFIIPTSFQLFGTTYKVVQPNKVDKDGNVGEYDPTGHTIKLRRNLKRELKEQTYLHEITHCILDSLGYEKLSSDEKFVDTFSKALHQILKTQE